MDQQVLNVTGYRTENKSLLETLIGLYRI